MAINIFRREKINLELLIFLLVITPLIAFSFFINNNYPSSDAAFYSLVTEKIIETGDFPSGIDKLPSDNKSFPIIYPSIFFINNAISSLTIGNFFPLKLVSYISFVVFLYLLLRNVFKLNKIFSLLTTLFVSVNYQILYYFFVHQKQEFLLVLFFVAIVYFLLKNKNLNYKHLVLISFFCAFVIGVKQVSYIFVFLVCLYIIFNKKIVTKKKLIFLVIIALFSLPILAEFFLRTGEIFYPGALPESLNNIKNKVTSFLNIESIKLNEGFNTFFQKTPAVENRRKNIWDNWFFVLFGSSIYSNYIKIFLLSLLFEGFYFLIRTRLSFLILPFLVLIYSLAYWRIPIPVYFFFIQIFTIPVIVFLFEPIYNKFNKRLKIVLVSILVILIFLNTFSNFYKLYKTKEGSIKRTEIYKIELEESGTILSPRGRELALYQDRKVYWFRSYGNWSLFETLSNYNSEGLKNYMLENDIKYIFIPKYIISSSTFEKTWPGCISIDLVNNLRKDNNFRIYKEDSDVLIFKLENPQLYFK